MVSVRAQCRFLCIPALACSAAAAADAASLLESQADLKSWTADFVQTRTLKSLKQPLKTPGHLYFVAPNIFRWELGDPTQTVAVRTANEVLLIYPPLKRAERYSLGQNDRNQWQEMLALLDAGFPRSQKELQSRFNTLSTRETAGKTQIVLQPKSPSARRWMREMQLVFDSATKSLTATELRLADGSSLRNDFTNERRNTDIAPELFKPDIPPDYKVIQPTKSKRRADIGTRTTCPLGLQRADSLFSPGKDEFPRVPFQSPSLTLSRSHDLRTTDHWPLIADH